MNNIQGFVKSEAVYRALNTGFLSGENLVLWGPGGYGKSEMAVAFLKQKGVPDEDIMVKNLGKGTRVDDLFGIPNIKILSETGECYRNLHHSIFSKPYLILEEGFDAALAVLESLKDPLTAGIVRNGHETYEIQTKYIIVCTNRSKEELMEDLSSKALLERFPLSLKVFWDSHKPSDYIDMIMCRKGTISGEMTYLLNYILKSIEEDDTKEPPAPRTVMRMNNVFLNAGVEGLIDLDGLPNIDKALNAFKHEYVPTTPREVVGNKLPRTGLNVHLYTQERDALRAMVAKGMSKTSINYGTFKEKLDRLDDYKGIVSLSKINQDRHGILSFVK